MTEQRARRLAQQLLRIGAVTLSPRNPFTWASGLHSPVYCDNRMTLGYPEIRTQISEGFEQLILDNDLDCNVIGGIATAGIPHAAWLAQRMNSPMMYVRGQAKSHGRQNQIEGMLPPQSNVVLIEDLVSTGLSSLAAVPAVTEAGSSVSAILAIFTYGLEKSKTAFKEAGVNLFTLTDYPTLIEIAADEGSIDTSDLESLQSWYADPVKWSENRSS